MIKTSNTTLKKILIKTKRAVFSEIVGNNASNLKGEGYDFCELKEYEYGEDVKNIDWVISAKMQKPYSKVYHAQKELNICIVPILNGSVFFGSHKLKYEVITEIATILAYSCVKQGDPFESYIANEHVQLNNKKTKTIFGVYTMASKLMEYNCLNKTLNYQNITDELYKKVNKRSLLFLIGDFFDTSTLDLKLLNKKHEVIIIIVRDHFEENPIKLGNVNLVDPSSNMKFEGNINSSLIKNYQKKVKQNDHDFFTNLQQNGIKFTKIYTNEEPYSKIAGLINR
jgi:uncharacterized protein (DUF58 family)